MAIRRFHWDVVNDCVLHETDGNGDTLVQYTHEPGQFGPLLSENRDGAESYHHYDAIGSTTMLTDNAGDVTDTFTFDAWGNQVARTGTTETPYTWVGRWGYQNDSATTGGYYIRARTCQPRIARWLSVDPHLLLPSPYSYGIANPVFLIDPTGLIIILPRQNAQEFDTWLGNLNFTKTDDTSLRTGYKRENLGDSCCRFTGYATRLIENPVGGGNMTIEILAGMLNVERTFDFCEVANAFRALKTHVDERKSIINVVTNTRIAVGSDRFDPRYWDPQINALRSASESVLASFGSRFMYRTGCENAAKLLLLGGILKVHARDAQYLATFDHLVGDDPLGNWENFVSKHRDVPWHNWIPGDHGYIENLEYDPTNPSASIPLGEGHNMFYIGLSKFRGVYPGDIPEPLNDALKHTWQYQIANQGRQPPAGLMPILRDTWLWKDRWFPPIKVAP